jgi:hypothetical protein
LVTLALRSTHILLVQDQVQLGFAPNAFEMSGYAYPQGPWILCPQEDSAQKERHCTTPAVAVTITCQPLGHPKQNTKRQCHLGCCRNFTTAMSSSSPLKLAVEEAEKELKLHIGHTTSTNHPYFLLTKELKCVENVRDRWLEVCLV